MSEVRFYHLQTQTLEQALPQILTKALAGGHRVVVRTQGQKETDKLNHHLWTFRPESFLPHGSAKDGYAEDQPIWLTDREENPNHADVLILTGGAAADNIGDHKLCCEIFDGKDDEAVKTAREKWKFYKESGHDVTYWQQNEKGGWDQK